ncbi:helix-turn-helix transcriptional regulator [Phenylobacterium sp.]|uniref:helix-turn-helix transcriptional regulator n=1 Tax=Phenylobacterium sp. TaxID=1871053 RepID=UPI0035AE7AA5
MPSADLYDAAGVSGLVGRLYDAALDDAQWAGMATHIAEAFGSTSTILKLHGEGARVELLEFTGNLIVAERDQAWADHWHRRDLWVTRSVAHGLSRVITDQDLVTPEEQARSGFYQEWLSRLDIHHMLGAVFPAADGAIGVLGVHRPREAGAYDAVERRQAALVLPHLQRALRIGQRLAAAQSGRRAMLDAFDRLDAGVLILDAAGRILHANRAARQMFSENIELSVVQGRLALRQPRLHDRLLTLLRASLDIAQGKIGAPGGALSVPRIDRAPLALEIAPLPPSASVTGLQQPAVLIHIRDPEAPLAAARLRELFGLTRSESVVAAALGRGASLDEIAAETGVGLATVRSHLKRILAKTGTHRQAEAAALLARSVSAASSSDH